MKLPHKPLVWVGATKKELMALPLEIRAFFGHALDLAQRGDKHDSAKVLHGFGCAGVLEIVEDDAGGTYRAVYTVKFEEAVFVLHCFQKKSKSGIATPKQEMDLVRPACIAHNCGSRSYDMKKRIVDGIEFEPSSGNVFADLGLPDAEKLQIKSGLVGEIRNAMRKLELTQEEAARRMGIVQPKVSGMLRGDFSGLSERKLMDCLNRLGYDIEIRVKPAENAIGHLKLALL